MREVSCRPVRSDEETLTGAPRCSRILTFRSRSMPETGLGEVLAGEDEKPQLLNIHGSFNTSLDGGTAQWSRTLLLQRTQSGLQYPYGGGYKPPLTPVPGDSMHLLTFMGTGHTRGKHP